MTLALYFGFGVVTMTVKFVFAVIAARLSASAKQRLKSTWSAFSFLIGIAFWPIELAHMAYVLLNEAISAILEGA